MSAPLTLRGMGSFHIGGRIIEIAGKAEKEMVFSRGGNSSSVTLDIPKVTVTAPAKG